MATNVLETSINNAKTFIENLSAEISKKAEERDAAFNTANVEIIEMTNQLNAAKSSYQQMLSVFQANNSINTEFGFNFLEVEDSGKNKNTKGTKSGTRARKKKQDNSTEDSEDAENENSNLDFAENQDTYFHEDTPEMYA